MAFLVKISHLDPGSDEKIHFTHQNILELYPCLYAVQVQSFLGPGPGTGRKNLRYVISINACVKESITND